MNLMPRKIRRAVVREDLFAITQDTYRALVLHQFIYWSERMSDVDRYIAEETYRCQQDGGIANLSPSHGWIYKSAEELMDEAMLSVSRQTVNRLLQSLVDDGYLLVRNNPEHKYDRTKQYRVNFVSIRTDLRAMGYLHSELAWIVGEDEGVLTESDPMLTVSIGESNQSHARLRNEPRKVQFERLKAHLERAIPEITTEIKKDHDDHLHAQTQDNIQYSPNKTQSRLTEPSLLNDPWEASGNSTATEAHAWKGSGGLVAGETHNEMTSLPNEVSVPIRLSPKSQSPELIVTTVPSQPTVPASSVVSKVNDDSPPLPTLNDIFVAIEQRMSEKLGRPYMTKPGEYHAIRNFLASGIPGEFILSGIEYTFTHFADKQPNSFAYCAKITEQLWRSELEKSTPPEPIDFSAPRTEHNPPRRSRPDRGSQAKGKPDRDERYAAFYELFPDA